ncbi:MAG: glycosyl hydrolase family 28-related protein [Kiritimatiellia bacterium]
MKPFALLFCVSLAAAGLPAVEVVRTKFPTPDVVLAERVLAPGPGDRAAEIQRALDAVGRDGGGTVFLPAGRYAVGAAIVLPVGVTLRGDYSRTRPSEGTVLCLTANRGEEDGPAAFTVGPGAGLLGLVFWYPEQTLSAPVAYPWTVRTSLRPPCANDCQTVADCRFVNAWNGLAIGPEWNELHTFRRLDICALKTGFAVDSTTDIGRVAEVEVSPAAWVSSGLPGAPAPEDLARWLLAHDTVGADYGRSDWEFIWRLRVSGYRTGIRFRKGRRGLTNAVMADSAIVSCATALQADALNGVGLAVYDSRFAGTQATVGLGEAFGNSLIQFHACSFAGPAVPASRWISAVEGDGAPVRPEPMARPAPASRCVASVLDFGADRHAADNTAAFQRALDRVGRTGGTVYVPAGRYRFASGLVVPSGVELRGCTDVPHHTCSGGSVLLPCQGKGEEDGPPFISLMPGSGVRGMGFWYPEQPLNAPVAYPWTIRARGVDCWLTDVTIGNGWQGVDFASAPSGGHRISGLSGNCWRRALRVGQSGRRGWVEDLQFNPHYALRFPKDLPVTWGERDPAQSRNPPGGYHSGLLRARQEGFVFRDCADEQIRGTFLYATKTGLAFEGTNRATVLIHGTDTGVRGIAVDQAKGSRLAVALAQLVPHEATAPVEPAGIWLAPSDAGDSSFAASQFWVNHPTLVQNGAGRTVLAQFNSISGPVLLRNGRAEIRDGVFARALPGHVVVSGGTARIADCAFRDGALKVRDPDRRAVCRGSSPSLPVPVEALPAAPPADFALDCEPGSPVAVQEGTIARHGGIRRVADWSCRVEKTGTNHAIRLWGRSEDPAYSFLYCEVAKVRIPVYPDTALDYRVKALNPLGRVVTVDLAFDDRSVLRESGIPFRQSPRGEWADVHVPLGRKAGRSVVSVMVRFDTRAGGGEFGALVDDIRLTTPNPRENWLSRPVVRDGVLTFEPPYPHAVWYTTDGRTVDSSAQQFTGSLALPSRMVEFRWSPSLRDGSPSEQEFALPAAGKAPAAARGGE